MEIKKISEEQAKDMIEKIVKNIIEPYPIDKEKTLDMWNKHGFIEKTKLEDCIDRLRELFKLQYLIPKVKSNLKEIIQDLESIADDMK